MLQFCVVSGDIRQFLYQVLSLFHLNREFATDLNRVILSTLSFLSLLDDGFLRITEGVPLPGPGENVGLGPTPLPVDISSPPAMKLP